MYAAAPHFNYETLTPTSFLDRAAEAHADRVAVVDGDMRYTYAELKDRAMRLAGALITASAGKPVAVLAPNTHVLLEAHYGAPWAGAPLVPINTRLSAAEVAYILEHSEAAVMVYDASLAETARAATALLKNPPVLVRAAMDETDEYEGFLQSGVPTAVAVGDEGRLLSINYTSGTTGRPKGVMYQHRGAYLQALAMVGHMGMSPSTSHLWTVPMFHCNGWTFPWAVTAAAGKHVCLPKVDADEVWHLLVKERITHFNAAPTVLSMIADAKGAHPLAQPVAVATGGSPPSPAILRRMEDLGFRVTHLYGLTETYGPALICEWRPEWDDLSQVERARIKARQGVGNMIGCTPRVLDQDGRDVPADGSTIGEIALRGNNVMLGYFKDPEATTAATDGGWFRTGDLAVRHSDGYLELRDRSKDIIISGGENVASVEVEQVIADHPAVLEVAVIGVPDDRWGEVPAAFICLRPGQTATQEEIISFVRERLARFKAPKHVVFADLPKTSTGKVMKYALRDQVADSTRGTEAPAG